MAALAVCARTLIRILFVVCGPSAVFRCVVAIIVDSIQGSALVAGPHIGVEIEEAVFPSGANRNSPSAVVPVLRTIRVVAASLHFFPAAIFRTV